MYDYILFDADGTLLDTKTSSMMAAAAAANELKNTNYTPEDMEFTFGITTYKAGEVLGIADPWDYVKCVDKYYAKYSQRYNRVFSGIKELLIDIQNMNIITGIITAKTNWEYHHDFDSLDISEYFTGYICAEDAAKPSSAAYDKFFEKYSLPKGRTLYVGDTEVDMEFAENSGIDFCLATWSGNINIPAHIKASTPSDILKIIK